MGGRRVRLVRVGHFDLEEVARKRGVDLFKVLSVYNFSFWFDGESSKLLLRIEPVSLAVVKVNGKAKVYSEVGVDGGELKEALTQVLGIHEDTEEFFSVASEDPLLAPFAREWAGWRLRSCSLWWALVTAVCQQNASFRQGWRMLARLVQLYGRYADLEGVGRVPLPPGPEDVVNEPGKLREAGLGYRAETVLRLARAVVDGSIPGEKALKEEDSLSAESRLRAVKGVGSYTARLGLALSLRKYDLPPIDRWVRQIASLAYQVEAEDVEKEWKRRWGRWSALAVLALTVALDAAPLREALARFKSGRLLPEPGRLSPASLWAAKLD